MRFLSALRATLVACALGLPIAEASAQASDWPNKTVRVIVNFGPGGSADNTMRPFAERLTKVFNQQVVIENRGGASGALGLEALMKSPPDGYTFGVTPSLSLVILPHLRKTPYDPVKDLAPVVNMTTGTLLFAVHPSIPAKTLQEFAAYAKANPGKISWGTAGVGSYGHLLCEAFKLQIGAEILHVPYRGGGESLQDFLAGVHQVHADPNTLPHVSAGKANLLAVSDRQRHPLFPNVPLLKEVYPELDYVVWFAMFAPAGTPAAIIKKMNEAVNKVIATDAPLKEQLLKTALAPLGGSPEDLAALTKSDLARYGALTKRLNMKAE
ncbi:MAG: tripartite tricarboxylate transporter substrate binding protein [Hyphomicrobiaceae bacterium]|nr:tripartite tricarboxylate transporter substrate binding protein [Hyphomicrobiaceae bacterium]